MMLNCLPQAWQSTLRVHIFQAQLNLLGLLDILGLLVTTVWFTAGNKQKHFHVISYYGYEQTLSIAHFMQEKKKYNQTQ